jgi:hypothetical protein
MPTVTKTINCVCVRVYTTKYKDDLFSVPPDTLYWGGGG